MAKRTPRAAVPNSPALAGGVPAVPEQHATELQDELNQQRRKVDYDTFDISVQQLLSMATSGQLDVAPAYQRQFRWEPARQSEFIESVFLGIPVPSMFTAANPDGRWELVDGVQRLSTLIRYAGDRQLRERLKLGEPLTLSGLEKLTTFNGKAFDDLPKATQLQFMLKSLKVVSISDKSDTDVRFDVFERLNTGGVRLTDQEIRACIYRGGFNAFLENLAQDESFRTVARFADDDERNGTPEEFVLRFFAFLENYQQFEHSVRGFLNDYMRRADAAFDYEDGRKIFRKTFGQLEDVFPDGITRGRRVTPVNLYEGVAVGAALVLRQHSRLHPRPPAQWINSPELRAATTAGANLKRHVIFRIQYCAEQLGARD
jgi:hypothetical protein